MDVARKILACLLVMSATAAPASTQAQTSARMSALMPAQTQTLEAAVYVAAAERVLREQFSDREGRIELMPAGIYHDVKLPAGQVRVVARRSTQAIRPRMLVWLDVSVDGRAHGARPVSFDVRWIAPALVTRSEMRARSALSDAVVSVAEVDLAAVHGTPLSRVEQLAGMRLRRSLGANEVIGTGDIERRPPIEAGEQIEVFARMRHVTVRTAAIAERDGFDGEQIGVRFSGRNERLRVRVIGENRAMVGDDASITSF